MTDAERGERLEELLKEIEMLQTELEASEDPDGAVDLLTKMSELAREVQAEVERLRLEAAGDA
jgi:hypothetical protein